MAINPEALTLGDLMVPAQPAGIYGDLASLDSLPGQNTSPPSEKMFGSHYIVKVIGSFYSPGQGPYFDPSYGATYVDANDMEFKAVSGYAKIDPNISPLDLTKYVVIPADYWGIGPLHNITLVP